jgi:hypothetical protein
LFVVADGRPSSSHSATPPTTPETFNAGGDYGDSSGSNRLFFASPTRLSEQKPFRGFDITSLIRKDDDEDRKPLQRGADHASSGGHIKSAESPAAYRPPARGSPPTNISVGPPPTAHPHSSGLPLMPPSGGGNPYTGLLNSGLYQQYLGQLLAANSAAGGGGSGLPPPHPLNPMLLQAQLAALAAQQNSHHLMAAAAAAAAGYNNALSERLKAAASSSHRFSPYPLIGSPPPATSAASPLISPAAGGSSSAFKSMTSSRPHSAAALLSSHSPPVSPPHSRTTTPGGPAAVAAATSSSSIASPLGPMPHLLPIKAEPLAASGSPPPPPPPPLTDARSSEIRNIENMINGLNGTSEGRFGLSH